MPRPDAPSRSQRTFINSRRSAVLATEDHEGRPRLLPICFVLDDAVEHGVHLYVPLDEKPKRGGDVRQLARVRDIVHRPRVTLLFDHWSEDWTALAWLRARGHATLWEPDEDAAAHRRLLVALREKYPQYLGHALEDRPMIRIELDGISSWSADGHLEADEVVERPAQSASRP